MFVRRSLAAVAAAALALAVPLTAIPAVAQTVPAVVINEIKTTGDGPDAIELFNAGEADVDLSGYIVKDDNDGRTDALPEGSIITAGGYFVLEEDNGFSFGLGNGDAARLFLPDGQTLVDGHSFPSHGQPSWGRCPDGTGDFVQMAALTLGAANDCPTAEGGVVINEIESQAGDPGDWVELTNSGSAPIDLSGYVLTDDPNDPDHIFTIEAGTVLEPGAFMAFDVDPVFGLGGADHVRLMAPGFDPTDEPVDEHQWQQHSATSIGRCPDGTGPFMDTRESSKGAANLCGPTVVINEIKSTGGGPDAIELLNRGNEDVDLSGYVIKDDNDGRTDTLPQGTTIAAGGFLVLEEERDFTFGLGNGDSVRLYLPGGEALMDGHTYEAHGNPSWGRCPDGSGDFIVTGELTLGEPNVCETPIPEGEPWPGGPEADSAELVFLEDSSGLDFQWDGSTGILWAIDNGTGTLWKVTVTPEGEMAFAGGWEDGKRVRFIADADSPAAEGPDAEGVTMAGDGFVYVGSERDNSNDSINKNTILKVDPTGTDDDLVAVQEWDLTESLPAVTANTGIEAIEWIPDSALEGVLWDNSTGAAYDPAAHPGHGDGLFFVAVEDNGTIYAYALREDGSFTLVTQLTPGLGGVMALDWDSVTNRLWAMCDDGCQNTGSQIEFLPQAGENGEAGANVTFILSPEGLPVANFEGFAIGSQEMCVDESRPVYWFEDGISEDQLRVGSLPCEADVTTPAPTTPAPTSPAPTDGDTAGPTMGAPTTPAPTGGTPSASPTAGPGLPDTGGQGLGIIAAGLLAVGATVALLRRR